MFINIGGRKSVMHRMYTLRQKQKVADYARMHGVRPAAAHFGIARKNVQRWLRKRVDEQKGEEERIEKDKDESSTTQKKQMMRY